jgi:hypothetical protein
MLAAGVTFPVSAAAPEGVRQVLAAPINRAEEIRMDMMRARP